MNKTDECVCNHPKSGHFDSTGRCAVIVCHCQGFEAKPPFHLPHFEVDENTTWKRLLGELTFEVASVHDGIDEVRNRAVSQDDVNALRAIVEQNGVYHKVASERTGRNIGNLFDRVSAIEEQLPTFKTKRRKKAKK